MMTTVLLALITLVGDGVSDDTAAIQERLDSGMACVYLPPPKKAYLISRTLRIGSGTELRLDRYSVVRLAPKSDCAMIENTFLRGGETNSFVAITGGIWDADNVHQTGHRSKATVYDPDQICTRAMRFCHVKDMTIRGVTIRNPVTYAMRFARASYVTVEDVTFDYRAWNPYPLNMDGVHLDGDCHHFRISNLRGTCFDDMVALNANDVPSCSPGPGTIRDIDIDGLYCDYCHSAVRLLSADAEVRRITIRNVHGNFYCYAVGLTHGFSDNPPGRMEDIAIADVYTAKALPPKQVDAPYRRAMSLVWVEGPANIGNLSVERIHRDESTLPSDTICIGANATVRRLTVRGCKMDNRLDKPIRFIGLDGTVETLVKENNEFLPSPSMWSN